MSQIPFSVYDFFGYLASGFVVLTGLAAAFVGSDQWQTAPTTIVAIILVVAAYAGGQVVANIAGFVLEAQFVGRVLGAPATRLFRDDKSRWRGIFPGYFRPLPTEQAQRVLARASKAGIEQPGQALFYHCFASAKSDEPTLLRLNTFLNMYGFARNMTIALLFSAFALLIGVLLGTAHTGSLVDPGWWAAGAGFLAGGLLFRYLKFYRHYAVEIFVFYAEDVR